jgi:hypothetical protein
MEEEYKQKIDRLVIDSTDIKSDVRSILQTLNGNGQKGICKEQQEQGEKIENMELWIAGEKGKRKGAAWTAHLITIAISTISTIITIITALHFLPK